MLLRAFQHWSAIFVLVLLLVAHASYILPQNDVSLLIARSTIPAGRTWTIVFDWNGDALHRGFAEPVDDAFQHTVVELHVSSGRWTSGWWAATRRNVGYHLIVQTFPFSWWDDQTMLNEIRLLLEAWEAELTPQELLALRPVGGTVLSSPIWSGYLHNAIAIVLAVLLALACYLQTGNLLRAWRARHRLNHGHCPLCNYDLRGCADRSCSACGWKHEAI